MNSPANPPDSSGATSEARVRALQAAGAGTVLSPGEPDYAKAMGRVFSTEASLTRPLCIVQPENSAQVAATLRVARDLGCSVTGRGGGLGPLCAADGAVMVDLSARLAGGVASGTEARVGGGATVGTVLDALEPQSRWIPVGVVRFAGMGLALQGGVGYWTRSLGLTLDHVRAVELVLPSGEVLTLSEESAGAEADLWWAVRGCAPNFGIVTSVTFRSRPAPRRVFVQRLIYPLDALPAYLELAQALPREVSASALLTPRPGGHRGPVLLALLVTADDSAENRALVEETTRTLTRRGGTAPAFERGETVSPLAMPPFDMPSVGGADTPGPPPRRLFKFEKSPFLTRLDATAAARLVEAIRAAPTPSCRIDLQHCGGAVGDVAPTATAFRNRSFEWNCPLIGAWHEPDGTRDACTAWVRQTVQMLAPCVAGTYCVEITPGLPETAGEVELAFGDNLDRLQALKCRWDPDNLFRHYYPLTR
jgi:FAD/FMN-containing dehydrogenase